MPRLTPEEMEEVNKEIEILGTREDKAEVLNLEYLSGTEATIKIRWFDKEADKWVYLKGLIDEVKIK